MGHLRSYAPTLLGRLTAPSLSDEVFTLAVAALEKRGFALVAPRAHGEGFGNWTAAFVGPTGPITVLWDGRESTVVFLVQDAAGGQQRRALGADAIDGAGLEPLLDGVLRS